MSSSADQVVLHTAAVYRRNAGSWSDGSANRSAWQPTYDSFARYAERGGRILDLGCGSGHDAAGLGQRGYALIGLDLTRELLQMADNQPGLRGRVVLGDLRTLPFREAQFAAIWADGSMHHVAKSDLPGALAECRRVLQPGGVLFASFERGSSEGTVVFSSNKVREARWYSRYEVDELRVCLCEAAFEPVDWLIGSPEGSSNGWIAAIARKR